MTKDEALKLALEALENLEHSNFKRRRLDALIAVKQALAQPVQREWVGLTDEEIKEIVGPYGDTPIKGYTRQLFDKIEAKLKEKNA